MGSKYETNPSNAPVFLGEILSNCYTVALIDPQKQWVILRSLAFPRHLILAGNDLNNFCQFSLLGISPHGMRSRFVTCSFLSFYI